MQMICFLRQNNRGQGWSWTMFLLIKTMLEIFLVANGSDSFDPLVLWYPLS